MICQIYLINAALTLFCIDEDDGNVFCCCCSDYSGTFRVIYAGLLRYVTRLVLDGCTQRAGFLIKIYICETGALLAVAAA